MSRETSTPPSRPERSRLSLTQLTGGALAAATAAALGSRLGLAGTITGAVLASLVSAVGSHLYAGSVDRVRSTWETTRGEDGSVARVARLTRVSVRPRPVLLAAGSAFALGVVVLFGAQLVSGQQ